MGEEGVGSEGIGSLGPPASKKRNKSRKPPPARYHPVNNGSGVPLVINPFGFLGNAGRTHTIPDMRWEERVWAARESAP